MWGGLEGMGWGWIGLGLVHMLLFWGLVILGLVAIVKWLSAGAAPFDATRAIDILKARYARGDLTREQFDQMRRDLGEQSFRSAEPSRGAADRSAALDTATVGGCTVAFVAS